MNIKSTLTSLKTRQLLTVILPLWLSWILIRIANMTYYYHNGVQFWKGWPNETTAPPHGDFIPTITIMLAFALVLWIAEKDLLFTKLAVGQIVLYLLLSYCTWYLVLTPLLSEPAGMIPYDKITQSIGMSLFFKVRYYVFDRYLPLISVSTFVVLVYKKVKPVVTMLVVLTILWILERMVVVYVINPLLPI